MKWFNIIWIFGLFFLFVFLIKEVYSQPPQNYGVSGYIFNNDSTQVELGTIFKVKDFNSSISWKDETQFFLFTGWYSVVIYGSIGDIMALYAWNDTDYGETDFTLTGDMDVNVTINMTRPAELNISIINPQSYDIINISEDFIVNVSVEALGDNASNCSVMVWYDNSVIQNKGNDNINISLQKHSRTILFWNFTSNHTGYSDIKVNFTCSNGGVIIETEGYDEVNNIHIVDIAGPLINIIFPENRTYVNYTPVVFSYNVSDLSGVLNCSLDINNSVSKNDTNVVNYGVNNFTIDFTEGVYIWNLTCYDNSSNRNERRISNRKLFVDFTSPVIENISPDNLSFNYSNTVTFIVNVSDNMKVGTVFINLSYDGENKIVYLNESNVDTFGSGIYEANFSDTFFLGKYNYTVFVNDSAGNYDKSDSYFFYVKGVDLMVNESSMNFPESAVEFQKVLLNITVFNLGNLDASNVNVTLYEGSNLIYNVSRNISGFSFVNVYYNWTAKIGTNLITARIDPPLSTNGTIVEFNESNNEFSNNITVTAYQTFYGNATVGVVLSTSDNFQVNSWKNDTNSFGNIYAIDSDSEISWTSLKALSRDKNNNFVFNDFNDLDEAMNMTECTDSINRTYTSSGNLKGSLSFKVFGNMINDIPVVNSSSFYPTGILWDSSDGGTDYNGSQDIVFVGKINGSGFNGEGYRIKVPARLRSYVKPNVKNSIDIYVELV